MRGKKNRRRKAALMKGWEAAACEHILLPPSGEAVLPLRREALSAGDYDSVTLDTSAAAFPPYSSNSINSDHCVSP